MTTNHTDDAPRPPSRLRVTPWRHDSASALPGPVPPSWTPRRRHPNPRSSRLRRRRRPPMRPTALRGSPVAAAGPGPARHGATAPPAMPRSPASPRSTVTAEVSSAGRRLSAAWFCTATTGACPASGPKSPTMAASAGTASRGLSDGGHQRQRDGRALPAVAPIAHGAFGTDGHRLGAGGSAAPRQRTSSVPRWPCPGARRRQAGSDGASPLDSGRDAAEVAELA
jgi:hypothetical protein